MMDFCEISIAAIWAWASGGKPSSAEGLSWALR